MTHHKDAAGVERHCQSCHEDQEEYGFPRDENWDYGDNWDTDPPPEKQYCCCEQARIGKAKFEAKARGEGA